MQVTDRKYIELEYAFKMCGFFIYSVRLKVMRDWMQAEVSSWNWCIESASAVYAAQNNSSMLLYVEGIEQLSYQYKKIWILYTCFQKKGVLQKLRFTNTSMYSIFF